jgi:hypothetical protein
VKAGFGDKLGGVEVQYNMNAVTQLQQHSILSDYDSSIEFHLFIPS